MMRDLVEMILQTMAAGLERRRMPDFGYLSAPELMVVNSVYNEARNRAGAAQHRTKPRGSTP